MIESAPRTPPPLPPPDPPSITEEERIDAEAAGDPDAQARVQAAVAPQLTARGLVDLVEMANVIAVGLVAKKVQAAAGPQLAALHRFDATTRGTLEGLAPAAIPFVERWLQDHALVGAITFGAVAAFAVAGNMAAAKNLPRQVKVEPGEQPADKGISSMPATEPVVPGSEGPPPGFS